ncbi:PP2C family protein-serine/threonine phosphatase [Ornithinimicrobium cerasi]|uniref:Serine/threonine protein phosphatase PrpC n=1 Tax=Ornithinimicrobium cerasi TaxID=2248773 RepID=A0A285VHW2_9MICO|nr:protein phosphatase 2C domain-containing protein [Ornithinimicrobium cerasi]SOC52131.1 Serine/threonine protein phosphatase PrpC [Ornithinimicrobium cerasi]
MTDTPTPDAPTPDPSQTSADRERDVPGADPDVPEEVQPLEPPDPVGEQSVGPGELQPTETDGPEEVQPLEPPDPVEEEPEPFADGPPPLPTPMLVLDGELSEAPQPEPAPDVDHGTCRCGGAYDADGWCTRCGEKRPDPRDHFSARPTARVAAVCDRGIRHTANEDAMAVWAEEDADGGVRAALVVCDGVSSAARSAEASLAAAYAALEVLTSSDAGPDERLVLATDAAARAVAEVGEEFPDAAPSCTYVAAVVEGGTASVGSVGDSRAYWLPETSEPRRLTRDDSVAEEQVEAGLDRPTAESGPLAHTITRWLGPDSPDHAPETVTVDVTAPGWLLLCSDGLWNYASEPQDLDAVLRAEQERVGEDPLALGQALVGWANGQGGVDNITVALVRTGAGPTPEVSGAAYPATGRADESVPAEPGQDGPHG